MSGEPPRWRSQGSGEGDDVDAMIRSASRARPMTAAERTAGARHIAALTARPPVAFVGRWTLLGGSILLAGALVLVLTRRHGPVHATIDRPVANGVAIPTRIVPVPPPDPRPVLVPPLPVPRVATPSAHPDAPRRLVAPVRTAPVRELAPPSVPEADRLDREAALLATAQRQIALDPTAALATLGDYDARFARGQLVQERDAIEIHALVRLGRLDTARARAARALAVDHGSAYRLRIERLLSEQPATP